MSDNAPLFLVLLLALIVEGVRQYSKSKTKSSERLLTLSEYREQDTGDEGELQLDTQQLSMDSDNQLRRFSDRLGRAGYVEIEERKKVRRVGLGLGFLFFCLLILVFKQNSYVFSFLFAVCGVYLALLIFLYFLKYQQSEQEREALFRLPIFLESIILLVESGMGVLPAVQNVVSSRREGRVDPVRRVMQEVYRLTASGIPFGDALELVSGVVQSKPLRHVLLHLDVSASEGGALIPSLRSLSDYAQKEWKLSVEGRVKRLENLVVFPVFVSVIGLMILTVAVPLVPVADFFGDLEKSSQRKTQLKSKIAQAGRRGAASQVFGAVK